MSQYGWLELVRWLEKNNSNTTNVLWLFFWGIVTDSVSGYGLNFFMFFFCFSFFFEFPGPVRCDWASTVPGAGTITVELVRKLTPMGKKLRVTWYERISIKKPLLKLVQVPGPQKPFAPPVLPFVCIWTAWSKLRPCHDHCFSTFWKKIHPSRFQGDSIHQEQCSIPLPIIKSKGSKFKNKIFNSWVLDHCSDDWGVLGL